MSPELMAAYKSTCYQVQANGLTFELFIGKLNSSFAEYCQQKNIQQWAIITAYNPYSEPASAQNNQDANLALSTELKALGYEFYQGDGVGEDTSKWPVEYGFWIWNIELEKAKELAIKYQQKAFVAGADDTIPQLIHF